MFFDHPADDLDRLPGRVRPLHRDVGEVGVLGTALGRRGHLYEFCPGRGPHVPHGNLVLVQASVGERRRKTGELRVVHRDVLVGLLGLGYPRELTRDRRLAGHPDRERLVGAVFLARDDLQPVTGGLLPGPPEQHAAVLGEVFAHVEGVALAVPATSASSGTEWPFPLSALSGGSPADKNAAKSTTNVATKVKNNRSRATVSFTVIGYDTSCLALTVTSGSWMW